MPTVLIIDLDRVARFAGTQADCTARTELSDILAALDALAGESS
jgi:hypothetical protein